MGVSIDYCEHVLAQWAENLWSANLTPDQRKNESALRDTFRAAYIGKNESPRGLKKLSEQAFVTLCYGAAFGESVSKTMTDAVMGSRLVDTWRRNVHAARLQSRYSFVERQVDFTEIAQNLDAAVEAFPKNMASSAAEIAETLATHPLVRDRTDPIGRALKAVAARQAK